MWGRTAHLPLPVLVYRAGNAELQEVLLKGMPLGSFPGFPYKEDEVELESGDTVLLMSDGFAELFNEAGDMLGYKEAAQLFGEMAHEPVSVIIERLVLHAKTWPNGRAVEDDMTFVVIKKK
jgi:sigma-B regulation protein RsbU (phosphoserine phosphatase)